MSDETDFRVDIGSADRGRTFIRVVHLPSGKERLIVGLGGKDTKSVADRLIEELKLELGILS